MLVNGDTRVGIFTKQNISAQNEVRTRYEKLVFCVSRRMLRPINGVLKLFFDYRYDTSVDNDFIMKPAKTVSWMSRSNNNKGKSNVKKKN